MEVAEDPVDQATASSTCVEILSLSVRSNNSVNPEDVDLQHIGVLRVFQVNL